MRITKTVMFRILELLDWTGHVELPTNDMDWLSEMLANRLTNPNKKACEACGLVKEIIVETPLGNMCEECIENASDEAEIMREDLEG